MHQTGACIKVEYSTIVKHKFLTTLLLQLDIKLTDHGSLETHGENLGENKDLLDLPLEEHVAWINTQLFQTWLENYDNEIIIMI